MGWRLFVFFIVNVIVFGLFIVSVIVLAAVFGLLSGFSQKNTRLSLVNQITKVFRGQTIQPRNGTPYSLIRIDGQLYYVTIHKGPPGTSRSRHQQFLGISAVWVGPKESQEPDEPFRMSLTLERVERRWRGKQRVPDLELGKPEFDRCFYIKSNNDKKAIEILNSRAQHLIQEIYREGMMLRFELRVSGKQLQLDKGIPSSRWTSAKACKLIRQFAELHRTVIDATMMIGQVEIEEVLLGDTVCLICGELVSTPAVTCSGCRTEYHLDCWKYVGQCGRYACGGTHFEHTAKDGSSVGSDGLFRIDE